MAIMTEEFLDVLRDKGPATIVSINGKPASVVNTWSQYINVVADDTILIPAAGMHSIQNDLKADHIHGSGKFITEETYFDQMKAQFEWIRAVLVVKISDIEQKIQSIMMASR